MPSFSRAHSGIILLLAAVLLIFYIWRVWFGPGWPCPAAKTPYSVYVEVAGEVTRPGVYSFPAPPTLPEVWRQAGGPMPPPASHQKLAPGSRLTVSEGGKYTLGHMSGDKLLTLGLALDLNAASREDLEALPGVGPVLAGRILAYRQARGPFRQLDDLLRVPGIGPQKLKQLRPFLTLEERDSPPPSP